MIADYLIQFIVLILEAIFVIGVFFVMGISIYFMDKWSHEEK